MTIQTDVALSGWCTLEVGGPARWFCQAVDQGALRDALAWARARDARVHILGGGSNVVFADEGFDGLVVRVDIRGVTSTAAEGCVTFSAGAGEPWDPFVAATIADGCGGLECLSGIPGLVGGTPVQNVGAYGQEVSDTIARVHVWDRARHQPAMLSTRECGFGYRTSRFKREDRTRFVVTRVDFALPQNVRPTVSYADVVSYFEQVGDPSPSLPDVREAVLRIRRGKGMVIEDASPANRSVGSFFVNPVITDRHFARVRTNDAIPHYRMGSDAVKIPAAWLIEQAGFARGFKRGAVGVSPFQAQAIVNNGGASAGDVVALAFEIKRAVWQAFEILLVPEPVFAGFPRSAELQWLLDARPGH